MRATPNLLASVGFALTASLTAVIASCSSDDNPAPTVTPPPADAGSSGTSGTSGTSGGADGGCTSDASTCNSCVAAETDPYNACSSAVGGCIPFDNAARVPKDPSGGVPQVP